MHRSLMPTLQQLQEHDGVIVHLVLGSEEQCDALPPGHFAQIGKRRCRALTLQFIEVAAFELGSAPAHGQTSAAILPRARHHAATRPWLPLLGDAA